jgi:chromate reductase, NAD(P)H dehydrogenase (quinone)
MKLLAISGSLRRDSHNTKLLRAAEELVPAGMEFQLWDGLKEIPPYDEEDDVDPAPPAVAAFRTAIAEADAILISTPEYNSSIPGQLKNAIDWASRPHATNVLRNEPVAVIGASTGAFGAVWSQAELRKVLGATGARVVDADVALGHAHTKFSEEGELLDEAARDQLAEVVLTLLAETPAPQHANPYLLGEEAREARSVAGNVVAA